ncbi:FtsK/SpoIIIE domain-containing protein [Actinocorallia aurantiaca]|uniref:FtsK domain-containing protein n=1 Tax=Actinocorallia aurantiaca TaxID=46204 RepID=A0ABN3U9A9_9ACTN
MTDVHETPRDRRWLKAVPDPVEPFEEGPESDDEFGRESVETFAGSGGAGTGAGGAATPDTPITRGREAAPTPAILRALRRDVFYVRVPKDPEKAARKAERSFERKVIARTWRTRRVMAPAYGTAALAGIDAFLLDLPPVELTGPLAGAAALAWWRHNWRRSGVRVDISAVRGLRPRVEAWRSSRRFVKRWPYTCRDLGTVGMKLVRITCDEWSASVDIRTTVKHGIPEVRNLLPALERALDAQRGSARVLAVPENNKARLIRVRVMTEDPHAEAILPPAFVPVSLAEPLLEFGIFETGEPVRFDLRVNTLVAGETGAGKSMVLQNLLRLASRVEWLSLVLLDMGSGATEFGAWRGRADVVGTSTEDAERIIDVLLAERQWRGEQMEARGLKNWHPTPEHPHILFVVDEAQVLTEEGYGDLLVSVAAEGRKFGITLVLATQNPVAASVPAKVKRNLPQTIGLRVRDSTANRVVFGDTAEKEGWSAHCLPKNTFLIKSPTYGEPVQGKAFYLSDAQQEADLSTAPPPVRVNRGGPRDLRAALAQPSPDEPVREAAPSVRLDRKDYSRAAVWAALPEDGSEVHRKDVEKVAGLSQKTCDDRLKEFLSEGRVERVRPGVWRRAAIADAV